MKLMIKRETQFNGRTALVPFSNLYHLECDEMIPELTRVGMMGMIFIIDYKGQSLPELRKICKRLKKIYPHAEIIETFK